MTDPGIAHVQALKQQASRAGLRFEVYLPPDLAAWLLDQIERGLYIDPNAALLTILREHREMEPHADLRDELLRRTVQAAIDDPAFTVNTVEQHLRNLDDMRPAEAAVWR